MPSSRLRSQAKRCWLCSVRQTCDNSATRRVRTQSGTLRRYLATYCTQCENGGTPFLRRKVMGAATRVRWATGRRPADSEHVTVRQVRVRPRKCAMCESAVVLAHHEPYGLSLDRVDNGNALYSPSNVQLTCLLCNYARGAHTIDEFWEALDPAAHLYNSFVQRNPDAATLSAAQVLPLFQAHVQARRSNPSGMVDPGNAFFDTICNSLKPPRSDPRATVYRGTKKEQVRTSRWRRTRKGERLQREDVRCIYSCLGGADSFGIPLRTEPGHLQSASVDHRDCKGNSAVANLALTTWMYNALKNRFDEKVAERHMMVLVRKRARTI